MDDFDPGLTGDFRTAVVTPDGRTLVGGSLLIPGESALRGVVLLDAAGNPDTTFRGPLTGVVVALAPLRDGRILAGGLFNVDSSDGSTHTNLVLLKADGSVDSSFRTSADHIVMAIHVMQDGRILVAGEFGAVNGLLRPRIARLLANGVVDPTFVPIATAGYINSLDTRPDGTVMAGGEFYTLSEPRRKGLVRYKSDGNLDTSFNSPTTDAGIVSMAVHPSGALAIGGFFQNVGDLRQPFLARLLDDGTPDPSFKPPVEGPVFTLGWLVDGRIAAGGNFGTVGGQPYERMAMFLNTGVAVSDFVPDFDQQVTSLTPQIDGRIVATGWFQSVGGKRRIGLARLNGPTPGIQRLGMGEGSISWVLSGGAALLSRTSFEYTVDGLSWIPIGQGQASGNWSAGEPQVWTVRADSVPTNATIRGFGVYSCGVYNGSQSLISVSGGPPTTVQLPQDDRVLPGADVIISTQIRGIEPISYQWCKDGMALTDNSHLSGCTSPVLTIAKAQIEDEGRYTIRAYNLLGEIDTLAGVVTILDPAIVSHPTGGWIDEGGSITLTVTASGSSPTHMWLHNGVPVAGAETASLVIKAAGRSDAGEYQAVVVNSHASVTSKVAQVFINLTNVPPRPTNDDFANASEIPSVPDQIVQVDAFLEGATREDGEPPHDIHNVETGSVWFSWVAPWDSDFLFEMTGSDVGYIGAFYSGTDLRNLTWIGNPHGYRLINVRKGQRYYFACSFVEGFGGMVLIIIRPPPVNDSFASALDLAESGGVFDTYNVGATFEAGEPLQMPSIWYKWTAPDSGDLWVATSWLSINSTVYLGSTLQTLTPVFGPYLTSTPTSQNSGAFRVIKGNTYYLQFTAVDDLLWSFGRFLGGITFQARIIPPNDNFADRFVLSGFTNRLVVTNIHASLELGEPTSSRFDVAGRSLWWTYTAPSAGTLVLSASGSGPHVVWAIYRGSSLSSLEPLDSSSDTSRPTMLTVSAGQTFQISIDDNVFGGQGNVVSLYLDLIPLPVNDRFDSSYVMTGDHWETHGYNYSASIEPGEPMPPGVTDGRTIWYTWVPSFSGLASIELAQGAVVSVFTGSRVDSLQPVRFPERYWMRGGIFLAKEGVPYHIRIDSYPPGEFDLSLNHSPLGIAPSDDFASAIPMLGVQDVSLHGATLEQGEPKHFGWPREKSVWLKWDSLQQGELTLMADEDKSLCPEFGMAVYLGDRVDSLQLLSKDRHVLTVPIEPERTYYVAVAAPEDCDGGAVFWAEWKPRWDLVPNSLNLLCDGDFETGQFFNREGCWHLEGDFTGVFKDYGGLSGNNRVFDKSTWPILLPGGKLWQDFSTAPGQRCELRFGFSGVETDLRVLLDDREVGIFHVNMAPPGWLELIRPMVASNATSRLTFECLSGGAHVDAVSVVRSDQPPQFVEPLVSASIPMGGTVVFQPRIKGSAPLSFQWFHEDAALIGQTNRLLAIDAAAASHEGNYTLRITNAYGFAVGGPAHLTVEMPTVLSLVLQPQSFTAIAGTYASLSALAVGTPPIRYQWYSSSVPLIGETNRQLVFGEVQAANAGRYTVEASDGSSTVLSLPALVRVIESPFAGGRVSFQNRFPNAGSVMEIPVFDVDGTTRLSGADYAAQLYAGPSVGELQPVGSPASFGTGGSSGIFRGSALTVPNVAPGAIAVLQVRAWQAQMGASYQEARALGGKFGRSPTFELALGQPLQIPPPLLGLTSFSLQAGLPRLNVGVIRLVSASEGAESTWALMGEKGFRYLIERSGSDFVWRPWLVLTNSSGEVIFRDMDPKENTGTRFYRSRILD